MEARYRCGKAPRNAAESSNFTTNRMAAPSREQFQRYILIKRTETEEEKRFLEVSFFGISVTCIGISALQFHVEALGGAKFLCG